MLYFSSWKVVAEVASKRSGAGEPNSFTNSKRWNRGEALFMVDAGNFFFPSPAANLVSYGEEGHEKVLPFQVGAISSALRILFYNKS